MHINLDESIINDNFSASNGTSKIAALQNLILSHNNKQHFITASRSVLRHLLENCLIREHFSRREIGGLHHILDTVADTEQLFSKIPPKIRVISDGVDITKNSDGSWNVPLIKFSETQDIWHKTILIGENRDDCDLYDFFGSVYIHSEKITSLSIVSDKRGGGGSTVGQELERILREKNRFVLCFVDSDQRCPGGAKGSTAKGAIKSSNRFLKKECWPSKCNIISAHEVENIIPLFLMRRANVDILERLEKLAALIKNHKPTDIYSYLDIKKGLSLRNILNSKFHGHEKEFWEKIIKKELILIEVLYPKVAECFKEKSCKIASDFPTCDFCYFSPKLPDDIGKKTINWINANHKESLELLLKIPKDKKYMAQILEIGASVAAYCCAAKTKRL